MIIDISPYERGTHAAWRIEEYEGFDSTPEGPYQEDTAEFDRWWEGFSDGTDDLIDQHSFYKER